MSLTPRTLLCLGVILFPIQFTPAADPTSAEFQVLNRYVGDWEETAVSRAALWAPEQSTLPIGLSRRQWILNGLMMENKPGTPAQPQYIHLMTYDPQRKVYLQWYSNTAGHVLTEYQGAWNPETRTFTFTGSLGPGITATNTQKWQDQDSFLWTFQARDRSGQLVLDIEGKAVRKR